MSDPLRLQAHHERHRRAAQGSLRIFIRQAWGHVPGESADAFRTNWHIDAAAEHLQAVSTGQIRNLLLNFPPGSMKSLLLVFFNAWEWASRPELRYLCVSFGEDNSLRDNRRCRELVQSEWYQGHWPLAMAPDSNQKRRFDNIKGGWRMGTSVGGKGLGEHPHRKMIDDPHNTKQAESDVEREIAIDYQRGVLSSRGVSLKAATVLAMQRQNKRDLSGYFLEHFADDWVHLCFPMRAEPKRMVETCLGFNDTRQPGDLLWPELFPEQAVATLEREMGPYQVAGQLQQRPTAKQGGILKKRCWRYFESTDHALAALRLTRIVISLDPALKAKTRNDYFVFQVWGQQGADRYYLRKDKGRWGEQETVDRCEGLYRWVLHMWPGAAIIVAIENTAAGPELIAKLQRRVTGVRAINVGGRTRGAFSGDKEQRAHAASPILEAGNVWVPGAQDGAQQGPDPAITPAWVIETIEECADFPNSTYDDEVDSFVIAQLVLERGPEMVIANVQQAPKGPQPSKALMAIRRAKAEARLEARP